MITSNNEMNSIFTRVLINKMAGASNTKRMQQ
jgi:hypothetical protein